VGAFSQFAKSSSSLPSRRFAVARKWAILCFSVRSNEPIQPSSTSSLVLFGSAGLYEDISVIGDAVTDAAAAAIHLDKFDLALEDVLARILNLPSFTDFLQPEKSAFLCAAAISGPLVIVNAHKSSCDALILLPHSSQVSYVRLPGLQLSVAQEMQIQLTGLTRGANTLQRHYAAYSEVGTPLSDILGWLWSHIVEPVLSYLEVSSFNLCPCL
jgi:hypothetical protein